MSKTFVGPQLRQLRRERKQTQAEMARVLGISPGYVNLLENNERSLSLRLLMAIADQYGVDWRELVVDTTSNLLAELRSVIRDPMFASSAPDLAELRAAIDHAPKLVEHFLALYGIHRTTLERLMRQGAASAPEALLTTSAESSVHDFFRDHSNYFADLEQAAERLRADLACDQDDLHAMLKARLAKKHKIRVERRSTEAMTEVLRLYDRDARVIALSEALDHNNVIFQLAHVLCLIEVPDLLERLTAGLKSALPTSRPRCACRQHL